MNPVYDAADPADRQEANEAAPSLTDEQRAGYEATLEIGRKVQPVLQKLEKGASKARNAKSIRLKAKEAYALMTWIVTMQNIADVQGQQLTAAQAVIGSQMEALREYEDKTGKKLWTPGPS